MKVLYDTSVLLAALLVEHTNHSLAFPQLELARRGMVQGYLSTHSLAELYSVTLFIDFTVVILWVQDIISPSGED